MLTSKQRAMLKSLATNVETILQIGKGGVSETLIGNVNEALKARELIKLSVLETAPEEPRDLAEELAAATKCDVVQIIGRKIVLFKRNAQKPIYDISDKKKK